ncbi:MAG: DUF2520 domain-containing protein [Defluviitaleaceae bacterium]|nr:DUF2520 domain-containing protein [Defluviitaleaceae bacterium]
MKIGFVGAGKLGNSLGEYFFYKNLTVIGYISKNKKNSREAAYRTKSRYFENLSDLVAECDIIFITVPDAEIKNIWEQIKSFNIKDKIICHCSGAMVSSVFYDIESTGAFSYSVHPFMSINNKDSYRKFENAIFTVEGSKEKIQYIENLLKKLGNRVQVIDTKNKVIYHASAVFSSNFLVPIMYIAIELAKVSGFNNIEAIFSIAEVTLENIKKDIVKAVTGPVERNDIETIKSHLDFIENNDYKKIYLLMSKKLIDICRVKNIEIDYTELENFIIKENEK